MRTTPRARRRTALVVVLVLVGLLAAVATFDLRHGDDDRVSTVAAPAAESSVSGVAVSVPLAPRRAHHGTAADDRPATDLGSTGAGPGAVRGPGASSSSDPHRLVTNGPASRPDLGPPDSTPLLAAAGNEPGEMLPVADLPAGWVSSVHRFSAGGVTRAYLLVRPRAVTAARLPVVLVLHGRNETPRDIEQVTRVPQVTGPAILVFPAGFGRSWDAGGCCGVAHTDRVDDVTFLSDTIHRVLAEEHDAAPDRVYMLGFSNGGRMAYRMACADPGLLAGVGAVESVPVDTCTKVTPVPIMIVAYSHDPLLTLFDDQRRKTMQGYLEPTVEATVQQWRSLDGCGPAGSQAVTGIATVDSWSHCAGAGRVAFALYRGGGHYWPRGAPATESQPGTPSAGDLIWAWLQRNVVVSQPPT